MMRIVVKFPSKAYDELLADLEQIPPRTRAERMRLLASIGAAVLRSGQAMPPVANESATLHPIVKQKPVEGDAGFHRVRNKLKTGLSG